MRLHYHAIQYMLLLMLDSLAGGSSVVLLLWERILIENTVERTNRTRPAIQCIWKLDGVEPPHSDHGSDALPMRYSFSINKPNHMASHTDLMKAMSCVVCPGPTRMELFTHKQVVEQRAARRHQLLQRDRREA